MKRIVIIGAGYVGIAVSILLSNNNSIILYDTDEAKVNKMKSGISPIKDEEMCKFFKSVDDRQYSITNDFDGILQGADYVVIAVPTNWNQKQNSLDISVICNLLEQIDKENKASSVIIKSTLPIGAMDYFEHQYGALSLFYVPEFLREGCGVRDERNLTRLIIGTSINDSSHIEEIQRLFMEGQIHNDVPVLRTSSKEAELIKLYSNAFLALRVSFFNEIDTFAEMNRLDTKKIIEGISLDPRIGDFYNVPSFGYGGYCLPKDTRELSFVYDGIPSAVIPSIVQANVIRKRHIAHSIIMLIEQMNELDPLIGIYRLNMKRDSDDCREAAILDVIEILMGNGYKVVAFEPTIKCTDEYKFPFINDLSMFKKESSLIVANRISDELYDVREKVYTRDWY